MRTREQAGGPVGRRAADPRRPGQRRSRRRETRPSAHRSSSRRVHQGSIERRSSSRRAAQRRRSSSRRVHQARVLAGTPARGPPERARYYSYAMSPCRHLRPPHSPAPSSCGCADRAGRSWPLALAGRASAELRCPGARRHLATQVGRVVGALVSAPHTPAPSGWTAASEVLPVGALGIGRLAPWRAARPVRDRPDPPRLITIRPWCSVAQPAERDMRLG